ncbi:MAG: MFS transporter [Anaeromyxobacteraceae bacterium]
MPSPTVPSHREVLRTYVILTALSTVASSLIWGINTLFLLDAGLSVGEAFAANAFFTLGQMLFEVPTGVVADTSGRRRSYLLGAATLLVSTLLYLMAWWVRAPLWAWAASSILLGLGFTFFSGATEAWLVDALRATGYPGRLDAAFARGQVAQGAGMLAGSVLGGVIAQATSVGVPYALRAALLVVTFAVAHRSMRDLGFTPAPGTVRGAIGVVLRASAAQGLRRPPIRWVMLAGMVAGGVPIFGFYAAQPYLLALRGEPRSFAVAGLAAGLVAVGQIAGPALAPALLRVFPRRTDVLLASTVASAALLAGMWLATSFVAVLVLLGAWAVTWAAAYPVRQAYLNALIPSAQRATVLSLDNLLASGGAAVSQPALGRAADAWGYPAAYAATAALELLAVPFLLLARRERAPAERDEAAPGA